MRREPVSGYICHHSFVDIVKCKLSWDCGITYNSLLLIMLQQSLFHWLTASRSFRFRASLKMTKCLLMTWKSR